LGDIVPRPEHEAGALAQVGVKLKTKIPRAVQDDHGFTRRGEGK
jgi:hypothetical protein